MTTFKLGKDKTTDSIIAIAEAKRGRTCDCVCPDCGKDFVTAQGEKNDWHFRHYNETTCTGGQETGLHLLAKEIIVSNTQITLPFLGTVLYDNQVKEKYFQSIQPDVTAKTDEQNLFFEVLVTHPVDTVKEGFYISGEHKSVEIDLQNYKFTTREELEREIVKNAANKRIIFWEKNFVPEKNNDNSRFLWLILVVLAFFGVKTLFRRGR